MKPPRKPPDGAAKFPIPELQLAHREDEMVHSILSKTRRKRLTQHASTKELAEATAFMDALHTGSEHFILNLVQQKHLLTEGEIAAAVCSLQWVRYAKATGRIFFIVTDDGREFCPAFFACSLPERRALGDVLAPIQY